MADNREFITDQGDFTGGVIKGADGDDVATVDYREGVGSISGESAESVVASAVRVKFNLNADGEPGADDDASAGYSAGSLWLQPRPDGKMWICVDPAEGDAKWIRYVDHTGGEGVRGYIGDYMSGADFGSGNDVSTIRVVNVDGDIDIEKYQQQFKEYWDSDGHSVLTAASARLQSPSYQSNEGDMVRTVNGTWLYTGGEWVEDTGGLFTEPEFKGYPSASTNSVPPTRNNFGTSRPPTPYDDESQGYTVGSIWIHMDDASDAVYLNTDATIGAAVWVELEDGTAQDTLYVLCRDRGDFEEYVSFHRSAETAKEYETLREKDEHDWGGDPDDPEVRKYNYYQTGPWRFVEPKEIKPGVWSPKEAYWTDDCGHAVRTVAIRD